MLNAASLHIINHFLSTLQHLTKKVMSVFFVMFLNVYMTILNWVKEMLQLL